MKLLFLLYDFYPNFGANSLIINNLSQAFIEHGHDIHILPMNSYPDSLEEELWNQIHIHRIRETFDKKQLLHFIKNHQFLSAIKLFYALLMDRFIRKEFLRQQWSYFTKQRFAAILKQIDIDIVINVCYPFESCHPILSYLENHLKNFSWIIYMQDPFAANYYYLYHYPMRDLLEFQNLAFLKADKIIVTQAIMKDLKSINTGVSYEKFLILNFPKISRPYRTITEDDIVFSPRYINCIYVGKFNQFTRNPRFLLRLFGALGRDGIKLSILGEEREPWQEYLPERVDNIQFYGMKSREVSMNAELNANILVNMGNSISNQLPSKLLEYISTGKPIINIYKNEGCPTLEYMDKYPVGVNILESQVDFDKTLKKVRYFCMKYKNLQVKYEYINKKFYDSTVDYVSSEFLNLFELLKNN